MQPNSFSITMHGATRQTSNESSKPLSRNLPRGGAQRRRTLSTTLLTLSKEIIKVKVSSQLGEQFIGSILSEFSSRFIRNHFAVHMNLSAVSSFDQVLKNLRLSIDARSKLICCFEGGCTTYQL